jgi:hypothetical protein
LGMEEMRIAELGKFRIPNSTIFGASQSSHSEFRNGEGIADCGLRIAELGMGKWRKCELPNWGNFVFPIQQFLELRNLPIPNSAIRFSHFPFSRLYR